VFRSFSNSGEPIRAIEKAGTLHGARTETCFVKHQFVFNVSNSELDYLIKDQIINELERLGISSESNTATLWYRLSYFASHHAEYFYASNRKTEPDDCDMEPWKLEEPRKLLPMQEAPDPTWRKLLIKSDNKAVFDGKDPFSFLERVKKFQQRYGFSGK